MNLKKSIHIMEPVFEYLPVSYFWQKGFSFRFSSSVANEPEQMPLCSVSRAQQNIKALTLASKMELCQKLQLKMGSATILPAQKILFV